MLLSNNQGTHNIFGPVEKFAGLFYSKIISEEIVHPVFAAAGVDLCVVRYDLSDLLTGGNKWFKLQFHFEAATKANKKHLLSFGGAWSNHIAALAAAGKQLGYKTTGIIRGEDVSNITLDRARSQGMELHFVSRSLYREIREQRWNHPFLDQFSGAYVIPEGGGGDVGIRGAEEMFGFIPTADHIILAAGTGTTAAGIARRLLPHQQLHVICVAAPKESMTFNSCLNVVLYDDFLFGGYARTKPELNVFVEDWNRAYPCRIEPIYTGKALLAAHYLLKKAVFKTGEKVTFLHTGGLQYQSS
jgi:1-aminocyclopropane-1-carboxylate deaminase